MARKIILTVIFIAGLIIPAFSQNPPKRDREKMRKELREFKLKFISQEIELKDDQKEAFLELYNKMEDERDACMGPAMRLEHKLKRDKNATEADYEAAAEAMSKARAKDAEIERDFDAKFQKILSNKQIFKMKSAENEFRRKMSEMRGKHQKKHQGK